MIDLGSHGSVARSQAANHANHFDCSLRGLVAWPSGSVAFRSRTLVAVHIRKGPKTWIHGGVARRCASDFRKSPASLENANGFG
jgi:hypothetical protein